MGFALRRTCRRAAHRLILCVYTSRIRRRRTLKQRAVDPSASAAPAAGERRPELLELGLLGSIHLRGTEGEEIGPILSQPKRFAVLIYLALSPPGSFTRRDVLVSLFWPESNEAHARNALSQSLAVLRQQLPSDLILTRGTEGIMLAPGGFRTDVEAFECAVNEERWEEALNLYAGDLLPGFHVRDAWGFQDWLEHQRKRLKNAAAGAAWALARERLHQGMLGEADTTLRRWEEEMPGNPPLQGRARQATALQDFARAAAYLDTIEMEGNAHRRSAASEYRAAMAGAQGRVREAERYFQDGFWTGYDRLEWSSNFRLFFLGDSAGALVEMREGLDTLDSLPPDEADPLRAAAFFARAGRPDLAREQVDAWEDVADEHRRSRDQVARRAAEGLIALAEGEPERAIPHLWYANGQARINPLEYLPDLAHAYRMAGSPDSARTQYERYLETPYFCRIWNDALWLPVTYRELAALLEEQGDAQGAVDYYRRFADLWQQCDPELRPAVRAAEEALLRLGAAPEAAGVSSPFP